MLKDTCIQLIEEQREAIEKLGDDLFHTPELGFKEFKTKELLVDFLTKEGFTVDQEYAVTGFSVSLGSGHPHIALIAEMDAIPTLGHPCANLEDQSAAHACGHSTQGAIMVNVMLALKKSHALDHGGKVTLFFTPAEEFTDMEYRHKLKDAGKIQYFGGKINMLVDGLFDDVDLCLHLHATNDQVHRFVVDSSLAGFIYKKFIFKGKASHAAVLPHMGVNALNEFALFQCCVGMLRETFVEDDMNRFHGIVTNGGQTVNSIPEEVVYESYIRSLDVEHMRDISAKLENAAKHCAAAIGGDCEIINTPGYLPMSPSHELSKVVLKNMLSFCTEDDIFKGERSVAAGDLGDLSVFKPTIQFGYGGFTGNIHGKNLAIVDPYRIYTEAAKVTVMSVIDLLENPDLVKHITDSFTPSMTKEEYLQYLNQ